eukprot:CAMPEP_0181310448 /NCGR_PEP_ID=MMETSP1101-20121128/12591_1 /TAXON_ID=46948 /ORGANISM="Rhodomonas abbreviata, Strain Caron Lab Isolate" /LENGTH=30 /DNA_ID= /DNA_START= /DNA_END= /DNA_ORIENTATION=
MNRSEHEPSGGGECGSSRVQDIHSGTHTTV